MMRKCHEVDYEIIGDAMQLVVVELDPRETVIAEAGAMTYMEEGIVFEAKMGDGSDADQGLLVSLHVHRGLFRAVLAALSVGEAWPGNGAAWQFRDGGCLPRPLRARRPIIYIICNAEQRRQPMSHEACLAELQGGIMLVAVVWAALLAAVLAWFGDGCR